MPASPIDGLSRPLAIALHDAGAANMAIAWAEEAQARPERAWCEGPARGLWQARFGDDALVAGPDALLDGASCLISGTGWASDLEHIARQEAGRRSIRSIAIVDHWVNYARRFARDGQYRLPDEIWVGDAYALVIATRAFDAIPVVQHRNRYIERQADEAGAAPKDGDILFVSEPAQSDWGRDRPGEFQALDHFWAQRGGLGIPADAAMRLRPHPSDPAGKFEAWIAAHERVALDRSRDMAQALQPARWVVGLNSTALVIALEAGREAISALPPHAPPCALPHHGIRRL